MRIIDLALKDLLQIIRDKKTALFLLAMPIAFTVFFGLIFGSSGNSDTRLPVGVIIHDHEGTLSQNLLTLLQKSDAIRPVVMEESQEAKAAEMVGSQKLAAALIVPADFSRAALAEEAPSLTLILDSSTQVGHTTRNVVMQATNRIFTELAIARLSAEAWAAQSPFENASAREAYLEEGVALAAQAWEQPPLSVAEEKAQGSHSGKQLVASSYVQSSPGMIVQFTIYGLISAALGLVLERKSKTLQRLMTTPISHAEIIAGKVLAMLVTVLVQQVLLIAVGQFAFGVDYLREPLAILTVMVALALWAASLGLFIGTVSKGEEQVILWTLVAMFIFSAMGGAWFPLEISGKVFNTIAHVLPSAWAMDGFQNIVLRGLGLSSVLLPTAILLGYALLFFGLAVWRFRFE